MDLAGLLRFIKIEHSRIQQAHGKTLTDRERILARTVKLSEEVGELCDEVLAQLGLQRKPKLENREAGNLGEEIADVIIVALLLAKALDVPVEEALERKVEKINKRYE